MATASVKSKFAKYNHWKQNSQLYQNKKEYSKTLWIFTSKNISKSDQNEFLRKLELDTINSDDKDLFETGLTESELHIAILSMENNIVPKLTASLKTEAAIWGVL